MNNPVWFKDGQKFPENLPVMVWIHGGAFVGGDGGPDMYGPQYLMNLKEYPVILVTINYRFPC